MDFSIENDCSTNADVRWRVNNLALLEKHLVYSTPKAVYKPFFSKLIMKMSLQMLRESRHEKLKTLIALFIIKISSFLVDRNCLNCIYGAARV